MKCDIPVPFEKLRWFQSRVFLDKAEPEIMKHYNGVFIQKKEEFSQFFYEYFNSISQTAMILRHERHRRFLKMAWARWFEALFKEDFSDDFLSYIWRSGLRHVEENIDQRFINLGYAMARQFCREIVISEVPEGDQKRLIVAVDKLVDLCLLVETCAYIEATSKCDMEVVKGLSHQVRNPITVIGGNIGRLQKKLKPESPLYKIYDMVLEESKRLERVVVDSGIYSEMYEHEVQFVENHLETIISEAIQRLRDNEWPDKMIDSISIDIHSDSEYLKVQGDPGELETMFYYLLENSLEAVNPEKPCIRITSRLKNSQTGYVEIEIFNTGTPVNTNDMENMFVPFYSTKPYGTGFGLPIAQLVVRKSLGDIFLEPVPGKGTKCIISLPLPLKTNNHK